MGERPEELPCTCFGQEISRRQRSPHEQQARGYGRDEPRRERLEDPAPLLGQRHCGRSSMPSTRERRHQDRAESQEEGRGADEARKPCHSPAKPGHRLADREGRRGSCTHCAEKLEQGVAKLAAEQKAQSAHRYHGRAARQQGALPKHPGASCCCAASEARRNGVAIREQIGLKWKARV